MLNQKTILITGGTGSFGQQFTQMALSRYPNLKKIVIFSRDKAKQQEMAVKFNDPRLSFMTGDMANPQDVDRACAGTDFIVHTAAMRIVPEAEANPYGCICTNILGAQNLIDSGVKHGVRKIVALSTDMASLVNNAYGASKMLSDKLFIAAHKDHPALTTCIVRFGNMFGSTGTVIPFFLKKAKEDGILPVTHADMTRFMSTLDDCVEIVFSAISTCKGGEIVAPKIRSYNILTVARAVAPDAKIKIVGLRPGEKLFEEMVTRYDSFNTIEAKDCYVIVPFYADKAAYCHHYSAQEVPVGFEFNSENNPQKFTIEDIQAMIRTL